MSTSRTGEIATARLTLRGPRPDDLHAMHRVYSDPRAMRYWATDPHPDLATTQAMLDRRLTRWAKVPANFQIARGGRYVGNVGNYAGTDIGFMLSPSLWRQGMLTEALAAALPAIFARTGHDALTADVDPRNAASIALLQKFGFHEKHRATRTFFIGGAWADSVYFALPRPEASG